MNKVYRTIPAISTDTQFKVDLSGPILRIKKDELSFNSNKRYNIKIRMCNYYTSQTATQNIEISTRITWNDNISTNYFYCFCTDDVKQFDSYFTLESDGYYYLFVCPISNYCYAEIEVVSANFKTLIEPILDGVIDAFPNDIGYKYWRTKTGGEVFEIKLSGNAKTINTKLPTTEVTYYSNIFDLKLGSGGHKTKDEGTSIIFEVYEMLSTNSTYIYGKVHLTLKRVSDGTWSGNMHIIDASSDFISSNIDIFVLTDEECARIYLNHKQKYRQYLINIISWDMPRLTTGIFWETHDMTELETNIPQVNSLIDLF